MKGIFFITVALCTLALLADVDGRSKHNAVQKNAIFEKFLHEQGLYFKIYPAHYSRKLDKPVKYQAWLLSDRKSPFRVFVLNDKRKPAFLLTESGDTVQEVIASITRMMAGNSIEIHSLDEKGRLQSKVIPVPSEVGTALDEWRWTDIESFVEHE